MRMKAKRNRKRRSKRRMMSSIEFPTISRMRWHSEQNWFSSMDRHLESKEASRKTSKVLISHKLIIETVRRILAKMENRPFLT